MTTLLFMRASESNRPPSAPTGNGLIRENPHYMCLLVPIVGAFFAAAREIGQPHHSGHGALCFPLAQVASGLAPGYLPFVVLLPTVGFAWVTVVTSATTAVQVRTPAQRRGRVIALYMLILMGAALVGSPNVGWPSEMAGLRIALIVGGCVTAAGTVVILVSFRQKPNHTTLLNLTTVSTSSHGVAVPVTAKPATDGRTGFPGIAFSQG
ncbi:MFS transporter [Micromonospora sp. NPDC047707]|uniref:MFS transporter n=1 Tax=Micromonospora sp. NPDC047707 TaxID=3154498 RepID=UPI003456B4B7